jgi:hypothetical protein
VTNKSLAKQAIRANPCKSAAAKKTSRQPPSSAVADLRPVDRILTCLFLLLPFALNLQILKSSNPQILKSSNPQIFKSSNPQILKFIFSPIRIYFTFTPSYLVVPWRLLALNFWATLFKR